MLGAGKRSLLRDGDPELTHEEGPAFVVRRASAHLTESLELRGKENRPWWLRGPAFASPWRSGGLTPATRCLLLAPCSLLICAVKAGVLFADF